MIVITIVTGNFNRFILFLSIILIHESGHILGALIYKWNIEKILILPFGGITIFNEDINRPLKEELIICILGPLFQMIYYLLFKSVFDLKSIHYNLLIFNLLPIIPLDGSKILNIILGYFFSFKTSIVETIYISVIFVIVLIYVTIFKISNLSLLLILLFLIFKIFDEAKKIDYIVNRFLLERYTKNYSFKRRKIIKGFKTDKMSRDCVHLFFFKKKYYLERDILKKKFDLR